MTPHSQGKRYVVKGGMRSLAGHIVREEAALATVQRPCWARPPGPATPACARAPPSRVRPLPPGPADPRGLHTPPVSARSGRWRRTSPGASGASAGATASSANTTLWSSPTTARPPPSLSPVLLFPSSPRPPSAHELNQKSHTLSPHPAAAGKCANRLLRPSGAPLVDAQMAVMRLNSVWCLMAAFAKPLGAQFEARRPPQPPLLCTRPREMPRRKSDADPAASAAADTRALPSTPPQGAFIEGDPVLSWAANNTAKLGSGGAPAGPGAAAAAYECWTLFSTAAYGRANKCPQEAVPRDVSQRVTAEMLAAFERALGAQAGSQRFSRAPLCFPRRKQSRTSPEPVHPAAPAALKSAPTSMQGARSCPRRCSRGRSSGGRGCRPTPRGCRASSTVRLRRGLIAVAAACHRLTSL